METSKTYRVIGGKRAYLTAVEDAYEGEGRRMHNPAVLYRFRAFPWAKPGFYVTSALNGRNSGEIIIHEANYSANTGNWTHPAYEMVRQRILEYAERMARERD